jgi:hypothetical protein
VSVRKLAKVVISSEAPALLALARQKLENVQGKKLGLGQGRDMGIITTAISAVAAIAAMAKSAQEPGLGQGEILL